MAQKGMDFKHKEVINISDGRKLGYVQDVCADLKSGHITSIIVPGTSKPFSFLAGEGDIVIPWEKIKCIGENVILVDL
jgi:YlmC/YmxH family sporulation protein